MLAGAPERSEGGPVGPVAILVSSDIPLGKLHPVPTIPGNPAQLPCVDSAGRIVIAVSAALVGPFTPNTKS